MRTRIVACQRHAVREQDGSDRTLFFKLAIGRLGIFVRSSAMPPFEGDVGFVETLGPTTRVKVLRQVEQGAQGRDATEDEHRVIYSYRKAKGVR